MGNVNDFTKGNIVKIILGFYFPMLATNMLQQVYNFADTAIVGNGLGDAALAAVGNMGSLTFLVIGFSVGLSIGFTVLIAQYFGAKNIEMVLRVAGIVIFTSSMGFKAAAIAEVMAWTGALLMNLMAFIVIMNKITKGESNGKCKGEMGSDNRSKQRNRKTHSRIYGQAGV